ncbi:OmpA family protein [Acetobacter peroxydans]|jgi:outer membrane protein OmpA-like peptidoglycan-associated protein|uniref:Membrane protein n=3 Tax=Acetobacter peroxydans TaxID=104098 RepID=A0A4Y3TT99_9PROT|nr:OmpA family protein [Acetobacter peroxydans]MCH4142889.1 OmpA family protein [Acetobacter peroxydans]MCI1395468.1 OmpA family protein [Acetobacter peroxydans]MCI1410551.1 OmpA family protein [Acetobacter peroxydans]MCI1440321.1 OmpA family protein [Acetobacter peroxydans]MCI1565548.1 OmpA family protein [Acetobacter peroxydans]
MTPRKALFVRTALSVPLAAGLLLAAGSVSAQPVQGLYVRGEGGATFNQDQTVRQSKAFPSGRDSWRTGGVGIGALGWGLGNGFRVEVEGDYRSMAYKQLSNGNLSSTQVGGRRQTYGFMANALFDLDIGKPWLFPYFGAGIGYGWTAMRTSVLATKGSDTANETIGGTFGNFDYQGIFGLSFPLPGAVGLSATAEYRFWTMLGPQSHGVVSTGTLGGTDPSHAYTTISGHRDTQTDFNHSLMLGLRYEFNPAPPPPPPAPVPAVPAPQAARSYLVFFDWDKADLTDRARSIVNEAAQASAHVALTRIIVSGYTDNSSAHPGEERGRAYNLKLSLRRAEIVKAELMRDGIAGTTIDVHGYGEADQLVKTGPNTKEPQNRRVEILFR